MTLPIYAVYGASGHGREVMPLARAQLLAQVADFSLDRLVFVDDNPSSDRVLGHRVLRYADFAALPASTRHVTLAIADSAVRQKLAERCRADGMQAWSVSAANVVRMDEVDLGEGAILSPFVTLTSNIRIGVHFHANIFCRVAHDCVIGDYVTFAPSVQCNGNVVVEDHAYIGTGAIIRQGKPGQPLVIGRGAVIGMGAVVTRDVPAGWTVVGNPAKRLLKECDLAAI
jgi:sugar O-acyltransferase (sialic acid O-acetyltransferase NeuD family)